MVPMHDATEMQIFVKLGLPNGEKVIKQVRKLNLMSINPPLTSRGRSLYISPMFSGDGNLVACSPVFRCCVIRDVSASKCLQLCCWKIHMLYRCVIKI